MTLCACGTICRHLTLTSLTSASPTTVCCIGHRVYCASHQFTVRHLAGRGDLLTLTSSRLTCGCLHSASSPVTLAEVSEMVRALPDKQCLSDPMPTHVLKSSVDILVPFLSRLFCWSLEHDVVPLKMKAAHITSTLKKADLDPAEAKSYRPISNLSVAYCPSCLKDWLSSSL